MTCVRRIIEAKNRIIMWKSITEFVRKSNKMPFSVEIGKFVVLDASLSLFSRWHHFLSHEIWYHRTINGSFHRFSFSVFIYQEKSQKKIKTKQWHFREAMKIPSETSITKFASVMMSRQFTYKTNGELMFFGYFCFVFIVGTRTETNGKVKERNNGREFKLTTQRIRFFLFTICSFHDYWNPNVSKFSNVSLFFSSNDTSK